MTPTPAAPLPTKRIETSTLVLATAITTATLQGGALVDALRQGGYVICFRHTKTLWIQHDTDVTNLQYCQLQRNLSGAGREDAIAIGKAFEALEIPVNAVYASPFCRTMETAQLAFHQATPEQVLVHTPATPTMRDTEEAIAGMRQFLGMVPSQGSNIVVVGHTPNMVATTGIGPVEGGAVIVAPNGKGEWDVVVQVQPEEWSQLAVIFGRSTP